MACSVFILSNELDIHNRCIQIFIKGYIPGLYTIKVLDKGSLGSKQGTDIAGQPLPRRGDQGSSGDSCRERSGVPGAG